MQGPEEKVESWWIVGSAEVTCPHRQFQKASSMGDLQLLLPWLWQGQARKLPMFKSDLLLWVSIVLCGH